MDKISIVSSIPWQNVKRRDFLNALEKKIFDLPLSWETKKILLIQFPYRDEKEKVSLLFHMLNKGVILYAEQEPCDWSKSYDVWLSDVKKYIKGKDMGRKIKKAFAEVNEYLDGFGFVFAKISHAWLFGYVSFSFEERLKEQMQKLLDGQLV